MVDNETVKKNDFVELEFTGKANGKIFDTTKKEDAKELGLKESEVKPLVISIGNEMVLKGFDDEVIGKEIGKKYTIQLTAEKAFGKRDPKLIRIIPMRVFKEKNLNPQPGMVFQLDNYLARILSVSGGRITADFNNPLAGKEVVYEFEIKKRIEKEEDKINALQDYFFKKRFEFEIKDKKVIFKEKDIRPLIEMISPKLKEISGFEFEVEEAKSEDKKESLETKNKRKPKDKKSEEKK